ncbi:hypothetical protein AVEN_13958-1 [Araneus ventricosus]|uniref:HAT C-terminal dimerisation domain-containing protein n=1 Tax=Araneus ventricosus TaxID=182803 RepID=A0A4Y2S2Q8_ARAVE|nr:hypothetical protein AVEN_13958-1 [Araneus ventricosus]
MLNNSNIGLTRFNIVLEVLHNANQITETVAERGTDQYVPFWSVVKEKNPNEFEIFLSDECNLKLDNFYYGLLSKAKKKKKWKDLWQVVKLCFIFSHGNASVERGFSVNKTILVENLKEQSLINQRRAYDGIKFLGGVENVSITKRMLLAARGARHLYRADLVRKEFLDKKASKTQEKKKIENELQQLYNQKKKIRLEKEKEETEFEEKIQNLEETRKSLL